MSFENYKTFPHHTTIEHSVHSTMSTQEPELPDIFHSLWPKCLIFKLSCGQKIHNLIG